LDILFGIVFAKCMFHFGGEISDFRLCCGDFSPTEIIYENFKIVRQRKENPSVVRPVTRGKVLVASPWRVWGRSAEGTILGEGVWYLGDIEVSRIKIHSKVNY